MEPLWAFLRDEQNREALKLVGAATAALALAGWAIFRELRTARQIGELSAEVARLKADLDRTKDSQPDILRGLARIEQRHDILFGVMVARSSTAAANPTKEDDEPSAKA